MEVETSIGIREGQRALWCLRALALAAGACASGSAACAEDPTQMSLESLLDVKIVSASKYEQPQNEVAAAASVITRSEIRAFGWRTVAEALASLPGIYTSYNRQYVYLGMRGLSIPGDNNSRVLVMINGNRVNDPVYDGGSVGREFPVDIDMVERIEFIPGPGGAVYGQNALFGVVNVVTRDGAGVDGAELAAGVQQPQLLRQGRASWGQKYDNGIDVLVSVSDLRARGQDLFYDYGASGVSGVAAGMDGERDGQFQAQIAGGPWSFEYEHGNRRKDDPTAGYFADPLVPGGYEGDRYDLWQLRYQRDLSEGGANLMARVFSGQYRYSSYGTFGGIGSINPAEGEWAGAEMRLLAAALAGHKLMGGLEYQDNYRQDQAEENAAAEPLSFGPLALALPSSNIFLPKSGYRVGVYGQDEWRIDPGLLATLGLRWDRNNVDGGGLSPRAALIWQADPASTAKLLYGRAHRSPNVSECCFDDGVSQVANPTLGGETIDTLELVGDRRVSSQATVRGSLYQWNLHDVITLGTDPVSGLPQYQTGPEIRARGVEISGDQTWEVGARLRDSLSYQYAGYVDGGSLANSPRLLGKLAFSTPLPLAGWNLGYEFRYDGRRESLDGEVLGGYCLSNLTFARLAQGKGLDVTLTVANLFGKSYAQPAAASNWQDAFAQDGRSGRIELAYRF